MQQTLTPPVEKTGNPVSHWVRVARWNLSRALIVTRREIVDMLRDWRILAPIFILTVIFPFIANWGAGRMVNYVQDFGADIVGERLIPFLLLVVGFFPMSFSLIIALESFAGEKERRSLEPLLNTPLTDLQLYIGKMLGATLPPLIGSMLGIAVYLAGVYISVDYRPAPVLLLQIILLTALQATLMVAGAVVVSSQATSVRAANLLASFIIIPMAFLIQLEAFIMFWARYNLLWWVMLGVVVICVVLIRMGVNSFNREELLGRDIDELDLYKLFRRWWGNTLARRSKGDEHTSRRSVWQWYRQEVLGVLPSLALPLLMLLIGAVAAYFIGADFANLYPIPSDVVSLDDWTERFPALLGAVGLEGLSGVGRIMVQNVRVLLIGGVLGVFTLGVVAVLVIMTPFAIIGFVVPQAINLGLDAGVVLAALLPHSILEVPAVMIAAAAFIRLGASVIAPPPGKTIGEGWMLALADTTRVFVCLVLPLLLLAAIVEIFITPGVVLAVAGG